MSDEGKMDRVIIPHQHERERHIGSQGLMAFYEAEIRSLLEADGKQEYESKWGKAKIVPVPSFFTGEEIRTIVEISSNE